MLCMQDSRPFGISLRVFIALAVAVIAVTMWVHRVSAQSHAQIGTNSPLPVFVVNEGTLMLPEGFGSGTRWRFTTWTMPSVLSWVVTVNKTSGPWANLTVTTEDCVTTTRWYYVPGMQGSWERQ